jgi:predicted acyl esterase
MHIQQRFEAVDVSPGKEDIRDGMRILWDVPIVMDDGVVLRADVYLPIADGKYPAIMSYGPYGKGLAFQEKYSTAWEIMIKEFPDVAQNSSNKYQNWEVVDPEKWVPDGYACVRVDSRGAGRSPGFMELHAPREIKDFYDCIEWAAAQAWSNGKIGLSGISYYGTNQWRVAALQPPHLAAICVWEGYADRYRDSTYHGGILCTMTGNTFNMQMKTVQHGLGERGPKSRVTGELVSGPETLSEQELEKNRFNLMGDVKSHPLDDQYQKERSAEWSKIQVPLLSCGNWGGQGLHLRGNVEGFVRAASKQKWLEMHGSSHWALFYTDYGIALQKKFFGHFLKGEDTGWKKQPPIQLNIRHPGEKFAIRHEHEWPLARTQWTKLKLNPADRSLSDAPVTKADTVTFDAMGDGVTFLTDPLKQETEITGPSAATLFVSSSTSDADMFLVLRVFDPSGKELTFHGALDPHTPIGQGWLRASHRKRDPRLSTPYRPYHTHDEVQPLTPGHPVELDIEIWPTCIVIPAGYRIGLTVRGKDYEWDGPPAFLSNIGKPMRGCGPFLHDDPDSRPPEVFGGKTTLHFGPERDSYLLLSVIPKK